MASAAQIEAFAWWLGQDREGRKSSSLAIHRSVPDSTAQKWVVQFNRQLAKVAGETIKSELNQHPEEYQLAQGRTMTLIPKLLDGLESITAKTVETGKPTDIKALREIASTLKAVYSLAEQASGADVAKRKAVQQSAGNTTPQLALPDLSSLFARPVTDTQHIIEVEIQDDLEPVIDLDSDSIMDSATDNLPQAPATPDL